MFYHFKVSQSKQEIECRIIKSGYSPKKDFTVPTPKASRHSNFNFSSHDSLKETEFQANKS